MASSPAPVLTITGIARSVEYFERVENPQTGESRQAARVQVLTDLGGFAEVYVGPDDIAAVLPASAAPGQAFEPFVVAWNVRVGAWNREAWGQAEIPPEQRRKYAALNLRFVSEASEQRRGVLAAVPA